MGNYKKYSDEFKQEVLAVVTGQSGLKLLKERLGLVWLNNV